MAVLRTSARQVERAVLCRLDHEHLVRRRVAWLVCQKLVKHCRLEVSLAWLKAAPISANSVALSGSPPVCFNIPDGSEVRAML
jgi:hypothetical protein